MRIGVYGGTFNPMHLGHTHILTEFVKRLNLDKLIVIPTAVPPHKKVSDLAPSADRLEMCRLALESIKAVSSEVSDMEISRGGLSYSSDTISALSNSNPGSELYFLMGEDMFLTVQNWYEPEKIFSLAILAASPRSNDGFKRLLEHKGYLENNFGAKAVIEDIPYLNVSSTEIREKISTNENTDGLLDRQVLQYITDRGLYKKHDKA